MTRLRLLLAGLVAGACLGTVVGLHGQTFAPPPAGGWPSVVIQQASVGGLTGCTTAGTVMIGGSPVTCTANVPLTSLIVAASSAPSAPSAGFTLYGDASGRPAWIQASDGFTRTLAGVLTANRIVTLPDAATTLPVFTQPITFAGPTAARTITLPDAAFTVARTDAANTFTGTQVFSTAVQTPTLQSGSGAALIGFGGTTSSFPGLKRNGVILEAILADDSANAIFRAASFGLGGTTNDISWGSGSPEGSRTRPPGSLYINTAGGANVTLYVKESGTGNTGWIAK